MDGVLRCLEHAEKLLLAQSMDDVKRIATAYARVMGFDGFGYAVKRRASPTASHGYQYFNDFGNEWGAGYARLADPGIEPCDARILHARSGLPANAWNTRGELGYTRPDIARLGRKMVRIAGEFGMTAGITVPCHAPGVAWAFATFTTDATYDLRELAPAVAPSVHFMACMQSRIEHLQGITAPRIPLSAREREVLTWIASGKTSWEASQVLGISEATINFHLRNAGRKLQTRNRLTTCVRAVALGLIAP